MDKRRLLLVLALASPFVVGAIANRALAQSLPIPWWGVPAGSAPPLVPTVLSTSLPTIASSASSASTFTRGTDYAFTLRTTKPKRTLLASYMPYALYAPDGKTLLLAGKTARFYPDGKPAGATIDQRIYRRAFSPDSTRLAATDEDGHLVLYSVPSAKVERKVDACEQFGSVKAGKFAQCEVGFPEAGVVLFHNGCRLKRLDVPGTAAPVPVGVADLCGWVRVSDDGKRWVVFEPSAKTYGIGLWYARARLLDTKTGASKVFLDEAKVGAFTDVQISPKGDRVCFVRTTRKVSCVVVDDGKIEDLSQVAGDRLVTFDSTGEHLLYADQVVSPSTEHDVHVVDFKARSVRRLAKVSSKVTDWYFFGGEKRVLVTGYEGATAFDLDGGWSMIVVPKGKEESEGFAEVPGNPKRILSGIASGPSTNLYWVDFPE